LNAEQLKHERFEELSALAAIGELSASEFSELNEHLPGCEQCREVYADFCHMASHDMGVLAAGRRYGDDSIGIVDEAGLLQGVLTRARKERIVAENADMAESKSSALAEIQHRWTLPRPLLRWAGLAACFAGVAFGAYNFGYRHRPTDLVVTAPALPAKPTTDVLQQPAEDMRLQGALAQRDSLEAALTQARQQLVALEDQRKLLVDEISSTKAQIQRDGEDLNNSKLKAQESETQLHDLQTKLQEAVAREESQSLALNALKQRIHNTEEETSVATASGIQDADARDLFGARDLHIVDVYDVDGSGKTKRTFGRVYYAEKKLLLFYAFDLQAKQNARRTAGFQAWGYRQGDEDKPHNLGLFLMDDPVVSRWVLKVNDTRVLERIDAVFVTLEPPNGSPSPRGRRLLYANLGGPPNHP
jgi:hypothetical protein